MKRGQITIFVIVAIVIVAMIGIFFVVRSGVIPGLGGATEKNPQVFLETCIEPEVEKAIDKMSLQGGSINPKLYKQFKFTEDNKFYNISYLCYTQNYYLPCVNQEPMLVEHLKSEIKNYISSRVDNCIEKLNENFEDQSYDVISEYNNFEIELAPKKVKIKIDQDLTLTKSDQTQTYEGFEIVVPNKIYDLAVLAQEIVAQEAEFCNFEQVGYMLLNPEYDIDKFRTGDSVLIYTLTDKQNNDRFRFAIRGCVIPAGF